MYVYEYLKLQVKSWKLTGEGDEVVEEGSHEARLYNLVPAGDGIDQGKLAYQLRCLAGDFHGDHSAHGETDNGGTALPGYFFNGGVCHL